MLEREFYQTPDEETEAAVKQAEAIVLSVRWTEADKEAAVKEAQRIFSEVRATFSPETVLKPSSSSQKLNDVRRALSGAIDSHHGLIGLMGGVAVAVSSSAAVLTFLGPEVHLVVRSGATAGVLSLGMIYGSLATSVAAHLVADIVDVKTSPK